MTINGKQSVKLRSGSISFNNYFKQFTVSLKTFADFECLLKGVKSTDKKIAHTLKNINIIFLAVLLIKLFVLMINSVKKLFFTEEKNAADRFIEAILKEYDYCKKNDKKTILIKLLLCLQKNKKNFN